MGFSKKQLEQLEKQIDASNVSERVGAGRMTLSYIEGYFAIEKANEIFGFDGWSYEIVDLNTRTFQEDGKIQTSTTARVRVNVFIPQEPSETNDDGLATGVLLGQPAQITRQDVGHGNSSTKGNVPDYESSEKEAVTDALKRTLRSFGNQFGNSLYNKSFLKTLKGGGGGGSPAPRPASSAPSGAARPASEKQRGFVDKLLKDKGKSLSDFTSKSLNTLTSVDASKIIDQLQN